MMMGQATTVRKQVTGGQIMNIMPNCFQLESYDPVAQ